MKEIGKKRFQVHIIINHYYHMTTVVCDDIARLLEIVRFSIVFNDIFVQIEVLRMKRRRTLQAAVCFFELSIQIV